MMTGWINNFVLQNAATATGNGESLAVNGRGAANVTLSGTFTATITFEGSGDGTTWFAIPALNRTTGVSATTATATGIFYVALAGINFFRTRVTWSSGTSVTSTANIIPMLSAPEAGLGGTVTPGTSASNLGKAEDAVHASGDVGVFVLAVRKDAVASNAADGDYASLNIDPNGHLYVTSSVGNMAGASIVASSVAETGHVMKASAGTLFSLVGYSGKASAQFIQIHNTTAVPADTAVPIYSFTVPATSNFSFDVPIVGAPFITGISVCNSSTLATKTVGSADCWFTAVIK